MNPVLALIATIFVAHQATANPSGFCLNKKCPSYTVVATHTGYEERSYAPSVWVESARKAGESRLDIFSRLFNYMKGKNADSKRIPMTLPVVGHLSAGETAGETESMRFYLGADTGSFNPPRPTDADVHIHHDPAMNYYVKSFRTTDWRNMAVWNTEAKNLKALTSSTHNEYSAAGYGPRGPGQKYNEIWMHTSASHNDHHYHHHSHNDQHDHHHGDHDHVHDDAHGHDHGGDHNH